MGGGGKLTLRVLNGKGLESQESLGKSDPYCKVEVEGVEKKTEAISNDLNPEWNEDFTFNVKGTIQFVHFEIRHCRIARLKIVKCRKIIAPRFTGFLFLKNH